MQKRFGGIDALRGVAITLVLLYHAGPLSWRLAPYRSDGWLAWPTLGWKWLLVPFWHFGYCGVHLFFVLSGFCIHLRAARDRQPLDLRAFFLRRFWRIYPPYWVAVALFGIVVPLFAHHAIDWLDVVMHSTMLHTFSTRTIFSIDPAFWSIATEEQFYLAYPLVLFALTRIGVRRVVGAALALSLTWRAVVLITVPPTVEHFMLWRVLVHGLFLPRWFEWLLGCWLAEMVVKRKLRARPLALGGALFLLLAMLSRVNVIADKLFADALFGLGWTGIVGAVVAAQPVGFVTRTLGAVGRRAYGLYLVHHPILDWAALGRVGLPVAAAAGWLFSRIFERPFERRSQAVRPRTMLKEAA